MEELLTQPCFLKVMPDEYIFSNALIELLGERPEEFARECVRYRMMLEEYICIYSAFSLQIVTVFCYSSTWPFRLPTSDTLRALSHSKI